MGLFDISIKKQIQLKNSKEHFYEFMKKKLTKDKEYEIKLENNTLSVEKCHLDTLLKYNTQIQITKNKNENQLIINGELHDTLILAILIILAILLTYGFGVILVVGYTYLQKKKATNYLEKLIKDYETIT